MFTFASNWKKIINTFHLLSSYFVDVDLGPAPLIITQINIRQTHNATSINK